MEAMQNELPTIHGLRMERPTKTPRRENTASILTTAQPLHGQPPTYKFLENREMFNTNCFTYGIAQSVSDTVITPVLAVARAAVITWDTCYALATHKRTITAVKLTCWFIYVAAIYAWAIGRTAGILARHWADGLVNECLDTAPAPVAEVATEESAIVLVDVEYVSPVVTSVPAPISAKLCTDELRRLCQKRGIQWRNVHGKGKHLRKDEMIDLIEFDALGRI
jgi:hypothetical protein